MKNYSDVSEISQFLSHKVDFVFPNLLYYIIHYLSQRFLGIRTAIQTRMCNYTIIVVDPTIPQNYRDEYLSNLLILSV